MASFDQKLRTLYLMEILLERTDDEHMLNASELCTILDGIYAVEGHEREVRKGEIPLYVEYGRTYPVLQQTCI